MASGAESFHSGKKKPISSVKITPSHVCLLGYLQLLFFLFPTWYTINMTATSKTQDKGK